VQVHVAGDVLLTAAVGHQWRVRPTPEAVDRLRAIWGRDRVRAIARSGPTG
jgi:hypothetical protein